MQCVCERLCEFIDLSELNALEFFAREGDWQTVVYADKVKSLEAWEINPDCSLKLMANLPMAAVRIGDSFKMAEKSAKIFNFVVFDNPMGIYDGHCEHFEALGCLPKIFKAPGVVIFNINKSPYGENPDWKRRRKEYYGTSRPSISFYGKVFNNMGYDVSFAFEEKRNDFLSYLVFGLI